MLPFFKKPASQTGVIVKQRAPDEKPDTEESDDTGIEACAHELINAAHAHDAKAFAKALKAAFEIMEASPHEESENNTYAAQNIKAGENS